MKKVKCIGVPNGMWLTKGKFYKKHWWSKKQQVYTKGPKKNDIVTAESSYWSDGEEYYVLIEWPKSGGFNKKCFISLEEEFEAVKFSEIQKEVSSSQN